MVKDSYANTFAQFVLDDYEEIQMIDLRFFRGSLKSYIEQEKFSEVLVLYGLSDITSAKEIQKY